MEYNLVICHEVREEMEKFFKNSKVEKTCVLGARKEGKEYNVVEFQKISVGDLLEQGYKSVGINGSAIKRVIETGIEKGWDIFFLIHNHTVPIFYLSKADIESMDKITTYLCNHKINMLHGVGIYCFGTLKLYIKNNNQVLRLKIKFGKKEIL